MPSLHTSGRHSVIDNRSEHYISFPDVLETTDGRLLVVYRESDKHINPERNAMLVRESVDQGKTWNTPRILEGNRCHCPRITRFADGTIVILDDSNKKLFKSMDEGLHFGATETTGFLHSMYDRPIELGGEHLFTTGHNHRGMVTQPRIGQGPTEQMGYRSSNRGTSWQQFSVVASDSCLTLCEASIVQMPDEGAGRELVCILRENSGVYEPMYVTTSRDGGATWSAPQPTPLLGHRPTIIRASTGDFVVAYRNVAPDCGTAVWMGSREELLSPYRVHGLVEDRGAVRVDETGLHVETEEGSAVQYALRPISDPYRAKARLELEVRVDEAQPEACCVRFGIWWSIGPDSVRPMVKGARAIRLNRGEFSRLTFEYEPGRVILRVNGRRRTEREVEMVRETRPILIGNADTGKNNGGCWILRSMSLETDEPTYDRRFSWQWSPADGELDAWVRKKVLELRNTRGVWFGDFGYNGITELADGSFYCVYHHADAGDPSYEASKVSWIEGIRIERSDWK